MTSGNSIKLFQFNQKICQTIGIFVPQLNPNHYALNSMNLIMFIILAQFAVTLIAFVVYDAKAMGEYGAIFFSTTCVIKAMFDYFITIWKVKDILKMIENCEGFIEKSESIAKQLLRILDFLFRTYNIACECMCLLLQQEITQRLHTKK